MRHAPLLGRCVLLALTTLSACAASTPPGSGAGSVPKAGAYGSFLVGQYAASRYDFPQAAAAMHNALAADPAAAARLTGETFLLELLAGNTGTASALATAVPRDPLAQLLLAGSAARAGRWHEALRRYQSLPTPDGLTAVMKPLLVAWAERGSGDTKTALATLQKQSGAAPGLRTVFALHTALIADQAGLVPMAAQNYGIVQGSLGAPNLRLAQLLASWDARTGDMTGADQALDALDQDLAMAMTVPALKKRVLTPPVPNAVDGLAEVYVNLAAAFEDETATSSQPLARVRGQQTVLILLQLALQLRPDLTEARLLLSDVIDTGTNAAAALAPISAVGPSDPLYPLAALRRAVLLARLGRGAEARQTLDAVAAAYPWSPEPQLALGDFLRDQSKFLDAAAAYTKALAMLPANAPGTWLVYYDRGIAYDQGGDWARAQPDLEQALKLSPGQPYVLNYLGYSWAVKRQHMTEARRMIEQALQAAPNDGAIIDSLGFVMLQQGEAEDAVRTLMKAVKLDPEDATVNAHLGDAYAAAGDHLQAIFQWRRALQLSPDAGLASDLLAKLQMKPPVGTAPAAAN